MLIVILLHVVLSVIALNVIMLGCRGALIGSVKPHN
jgi:hypothetical protein